MDYREFGLRSRPFRTTPDVGSYYPATTHEAALHRLREGLSDEEGLMLATGPAGMGKTLLGHRLIEALPEGGRSALLIQGAYHQRSELLQGILFDLGLPYQEMSEQELRLSLYDSCLDHFRSGGRTLLVVDEAHHLCAEHLEELRLLGNLEGKEGKAVQIVLLGMPAMAATMKTASLEIFRQRLRVSCQLEPLGIEESADYLLHQIRVAGGRPEKILGEDVLDILSHACGGIPRRLNQAAHLAFSLAMEARAGLVDAEAAVEAVSQLGLDTLAEVPPSDNMAFPDAPAQQTNLSTASPVPSIAHSLDGPRVETMPPMYIYEGGSDSSRLPLSDTVTVAPWKNSPQKAG